MATTQKLSTSLILDAVVSSDFNDAFSTANKLMNDLSKTGNALERDLRDLGKSADHLDAIGDSSKELRRDMTRLEKQIGETNKAVGKFGDAKKHFRNARLGASALKNELSDLVGITAKAALGIAAIGTAAAVALSPSQELMEFDGTLAGIANIVPELDASALEDLKMSIRGLSNETGIATNEIASRFHQLTRSLGFEGATESITTAVDFEIATGTSIEDIAPELATARISLGIDTGAEMQELLKVLQAYHAAGGELQNLDFGDLETLMQRTGEDIFGENLQRELLTTLVFRQVDSFQLADHLAAYQEEYGRAIVITPEMSLKEIEKAQENLQLLSKFGLDAEKDLIGAMRVFQGLSAEQQSVFREQLSPVLGEQTVEVIARGSAALGQVDQQVTMSVEKLQGEGSLSKAADKVKSTWSAAWGRIGRIGQNTTELLQEQFATVFGPPIVASAESFFKFLQEHKDDIKKFFTGVKDTLSPIIKKVWNAVTEAWPDIKEFATEVWGELRGYWDSISPVAGWLADKIWSIAKAVGGFLKDHPKLVATIIAGTIAFKAYKIASGAAQTAFDFIAGGVSLAQGHFHRLNATVLGNQRAVGGAGQTAISTGQKFLTMGKNMLATKFPRFGGVVSGLGRIGTSALAALPGIGAMGAGLWAAMVPILPVVLPIIAAIAAVGAGGYLIYKNWDGISSFFSTHFETIRNALMIVFPPLGLIVGFAGVIKDNWAGISEFFGVLWETVKKATAVVWEGIQFIVLGTFTVVKGIWSGITGFFSGIWDSVTGVFMNSPLAPIFSWMVDGIKKVFGPLGTFFTNFWDNISDKVGDMLTFWTEKFEWFNTVLDKAFGWLKKKNDKMKEDLGFKTETKVKTDVNADDIPDTITTEAKSFVSETYDINLDKLSSELANELSSVLTGLDFQERAAGTPKELERVNVMKQKFLDDITLALPGIDDRQDKKALEKVAEALKKDLRVDSPYQDSPYQMDFKQPTEFIQQVVKGDNLLKPLGDILIEAKKQTGLLAKMVSPSVAVKTEGQQPVVNVAPTPLEQQSPLVNVANPNIEQTHRVVSQASPVVKIPEQMQPVVNVAGSLQKPLKSIYTEQQKQTAFLAKMVSPTVEVTADAPVVNLPETQQAVIEQPTIETPVLNQEQPIVSIPEQTQAVIEQPTIETPVLNQEQPIVSIPEQTQAVIEQPTIETPDITVREAPIAKPVVNIPEGTQPIIDVAQPTIADLEIPSVEILNPDGTVLNVEQLVQEQPVFETETETVPYTPLPQTPASGTPASPQTTHIENETSNTSAPAPASGTPASPQTTHIENETSNTSAPVTLNLTMNITQAPGEDGEDFAERVAAIIRKEMNDATDSFLTQ